MIDSTWFCTVKSLVKHVPWLFRKDYQSNACGMPRDSVAYNLWNEHHLFGIWKMEHLLQVRLGRNICQTCQDRCQKLVIKHRNLYKNFLKQTQTLHGTAIGLPRKGQGWLKSRSTDRQSVLAVPDGGRVSERVYSDGLKLRMPFWESQRRPKHTGGVAKVSIPSSGYRCTLRMPTGFTSDFIKVLYFTS